MSSHRPHHLAVLDARTGAGRLAFFDSAGQLTGEALTPVPDLTALKPEALVALARELVGEQRIDAFIYLASTRAAAPAAAECVAVCPFPVYTVCDIVAACEALPASCLKFQAFDGRSGQWWLIEKRDDRLVSAHPALLHGTDPRLAASRELLRAFGFESTVILADEDASARNGAAVSCELTDDALRRGALRAVTRLRAEEGCHVSRDYDGRLTLTLAATKTVSYKVVNVERPVFSLGEPALADLAAGHPVMLIVDRGVNDLYGTALDEYAAAHLDCRKKLLFEAHDRKKTLMQVARFCRAASALGMPRNGALIAIGGGVTLDTVGLSAALYCKGIGYIRIPTTLIGLIDAGLGVKQAVNFAHRKNLIGAFYPPTAVINDRRFLQTLPAAQVACGLAEIVKIALIRDAGLFELLLEQGAALFASKCAAPPGVAAQLLTRASLLMLQELQPNLYETDTRRIVDFGHSFSPTLEVLSQHQIAHGQAVAIDMLLSTALAVGREVCAREVLEKLHALLRMFELPSGVPPASPEELLAALECVRQRRGGALNLVVPAAIGCGAFLQSVSRRDLEEAVELIRELSSARAGETRAHAVV
jgi:2-epi-5-epi-valiolone synthase